MFSDLDVVKELEIDVILKHQRVARTTEVKHPELGTSFNVLSFLYSTL
jgi:hypothetical protein